MDGIRPPKREGGRPGGESFGGERGQPRPARSHDGTAADVALRSASAWVDLRVSM
jgi:hypothetical protein